MIRLIAAAIFTLICSLSVLAASSPAWEPDTRASQDPTASGQNETAVAANPLDPDNAIVVYKDYRQLPVRDYVSATTDGGATWYEQPFPFPGPSAPSYSDPTAFFRRDGRAYITWMGFSQFGSGGLYISWSDDRGLTWSPAAQVTPPFGHYDDKEWLAFDETGGARDGTLYMTWVRFGNSEIYAASSTDGGATWSVPTLASDGPYLSDNQNPQPVILPDGALAIIYIHPINPGSTADLIMTRSTDGGATFAPGRPILQVAQPPYTLPGEHWRLFTFPSLARDPVRGWLTLVWNDYRSAATEGSEILASRSTDNGTTWSTPARLNDDPLALVRDQWFPAVSAAPDGRLSAVWLDRRDDPANRLYHAYARSSTDGGLTWLPSRRISSSPSDPGTNIPPNSDGIGDYIGISSVAGASWASWVDTRNGDQDVYAARDLFTPNPPPSTPTPTPTPCALPFTDVPSNAYFYNGVRYLYCRGIVAGYPDNTYRPYAINSRGQAVKIVSLAWGWPPVSPPSPTFTDVTPGSTFYVYVETAYAHLVFGGYSCGALPDEPCDPQYRPYFRPNATLSRGQVAKMLTQAAGYPLPDPVSPWFADVAPGSTFFRYVEAMHDHGVAGGYSCGALPDEPCDPQFRPYYRPSNSALRGQFAAMVYAVRQGAYYTRRQP